VFIYLEIMNSTDLKDNKLEFSSFMCSYLLVHKRPAEIHACHFIFVFPLSKNNLSTVKLMMADLPP